MDRLERDPGVESAARLPTLWVLVFIGLIIFSHWPSSTPNLQTDDYLQQAMLAGDERLAEKGFPTSPERPLGQRLADAFHFFNSDQGSLQPQRDFGNLPWWSVTDAKMQPYRPLAGFTHWLDYGPLQANPLLMQLHSLLYFVALALVLLAWLRQQTQDPVVVVLAAGLLLFDLSMLGNWNWLAARNAYLGLALGVASLLCYEQWRQRGHWRLLGLALALFGLSLLAAEASIALLGYFFAYGLLLDRQGWRRGLLALIPFVALMLLWRGYYQVQGFGASGIGLYIDPGQDLWVFAQYLVTKYPLIAFHLISGIDASLSPLGVEQRWLLVVLAWLVSACCLCLVLPLTKRQPRVAYLLLGSLVAAVPFVSSFNPSFRSATFVGLGFFFVVACWLRPMLRSAKAWPRWGGRLLLLYWLILPMLAATANAWQLIPIQWKSTELYQQSAASLQQYQQQQEQPPSLLLLTLGSVAPLYYLPYEWSSLHQVLPRRVQALSPGLSTVRVTRTGAAELLLESKQGFVLNQDSPMVPMGKTQEPGFHGRFKYRLSQGLFTHPEQQWQPGQILQGPGLTVELLDLVNGQPRRLIIRFEDAEPLEQKLWFWFDWNELKFQPLAPLTQGSSLTLVGPLDGSGYSN